MRLFPPGRPSPADHVVHQVDIRSWSGIPARPIRDGTAYSVPLLVITGYFSLFFLRALMKQQPSCEGAVALIGGCRDARPSPRSSGEEPPFVSESPASVLPATLMQEALGTKVTFTS